MVRDSVTKHVREGARQEWYEPHDNMKNSNNNTEGNIKKSIHCVYGSWVTCPFLKKSCFYAVNPEKKHFKLNSSKDRRRISIIAFK